jgi:hypothetical protein
MNLRRVKQAAQNAGDALDFSLFAPDEMANARHHDLARVNVVRMSGGHLQLAPRRSAHSCADEQAVFAVGPLERLSATVRHAAGPT